MAFTTTLARGAGAAILAFAGLLTACGGGGGTNSVFDNPPPTSTTGAVEGSVLDAGTGAPIAGALVQAGTLQATTATNGKFALRSVAASTRLVLKVTAANYAEHLVVTQVTANTTTNVLTQLLRLGATETLDLSTGGTVNVPSSTGQAVVPVNGLACGGLAVVSVTPINASLNPGFLPGDFSVGGTTQPLESYGAVTLTVNDLNGAPMALTSCGLITIRIPVSSRSPTLLPVLPLYFLDTTTGQWVREGSAALNGTAPNQYYEASVSHAGTWSVDQPYDTVDVTGCVVDVLNVRVAGARVVADGIDYTGSTSVATDSNGGFALPMKKSARAAITARSGAKTSNSIAAGPSGINFSAGNTCLVLTDSANNVSIKLSWGEAPADVDSHLFTPSADHVFFNNPGSLTAAPWANLDVDDIVGFGPEIVTLRRLQVGTYTYVVNNFSETFGPGITASPTRVELNVAGESTAYAPPAGEGTALWWTVFRFSVDAQCRVTVTPVNTWSAAPPAAASSGGAVSYCVAP